MNNWERKKSLCGQGEVQACDKLSAPATFFRFQTLVKETFNLIGNIYHLYTTYMLPLGGYMLPTTFYGRNNHWLTCYPKLWSLCLADSEFHEVSRTWMTPKPPEACLRSHFLAPIAEPDFQRSGEIFRPRFCLHLIAGNSIFFFGHIDSGYLRKMTCSGVL